MAMTKHSYANPQIDVNELVSSHAELVRKIAWQIHGRARHITEIEDLVQIGFTGLILAAQKYTPQDGANFASAAIGTHYRRTHYKDMVVHVPPMATGFVHTSGEVYEDGTISSYPNYPGGPMKSCSGEEDETCADQYNGMSVPDHLLYEGIPLGSSDDSCAYAQNPPF